MIGVQVVTIVLAAALEIGSAIAYVKTGHLVLMLLASFAATLIMVSLGYLLGYIRR